MTNVKINFPKQLSKFIENADSASFDGDRVIDLIEHLEQRYGNIKERLFEDDLSKLKPYFNLFIGNSNINSIGGIDSVIPDGETVSILLARAGG